MIRIEEKELLELSRNIRRADDNFFKYIYHGVKKIEEWFNTYWISTSSKKIAEDLHEEIKKYILEIDYFFEKLNIRIKKLVILHNANPDNIKKINYTGFKISKPPINSLLNLNYLLPNGKVGALNNDTDMNYPISKSIEIAEKVTKTFKTAIAISSAISYNEQKELQNEIKFIENKFKNSLINISKRIDY